jgi:hypothetical protein
MIASHVEDGNLLCDVTKIMIKTGLNCHARLEVATLLMMRILVLWGVTLCTSNLTYPDVSKEFSAFIFKGC